MTSMHVKVQKRLISSAKKFNPVARYAAKLATPNSTYGEEVLDSIYVAILE